MIELWIVKISAMIIFFNLFMASIRSFFNLKPVLGRLYCGIFGFSLKPNADIKAALYRFKILGMYNIIRGRDATGVFVNGEIIKDTEEFDDFIEENIFLPEVANNVVLGHTRSGSVGFKKTIDEAHPFLINESLVFTHNGSISNMGELCKKYKVDEKEFNVDSKLLGTLLYTEGHDVLNHYRGYAALAYTYLNEPNTLYLFHGTSKNYKTSPLFEERPLYYLETSEGIFYSSIKDSLKAIKENKEDEIGDLNHNVIFKIRDGEFLIEDSVKIDREEANVTVYHTPSVIHNDFRNRSYNNNCHVREPMDLRLIFKETLPKFVVESKKDDFKKNGSKFIYFHFGRYWLAPREIVNGPVYIKKGGLLGDYDDKVSELLFFYKGVLLKDREAYTEILNLSKEIVGKNWVTNPTDFNFADEMSKYSKFPVVALPNEFNMALSEGWRLGWYSKRSGRVNDSFTPKFGGRAYILENGMLRYIRSSHREMCTFEKMSDAASQLFDLKRPGIQGGNSNLILPFQEQVDLWFFEKVYPSMDALIRDWGSDETEAYRLFLGFTHERDFHTKIYEHEITQYYTESLEQCVSKGISLGDFLDKEERGDSKLLMQFYNRVLERDSNVSDLAYQPDFIKKSLNEILHSAKIIAMPPSKTKAADFVQVEEVDEDEDDEENETDAVNEVESCINNLEEMQASCFDLVNNQKSDFAQESANVLMTAIDNTLSNLSESLNKYKHEDLINRVKKIKETKNFENGIL